MKNATRQPPLVRVTVRGGVALDVTATIAIRVVIEDWDCPDSATGEFPYRHQFLSAKTLSAAQAARYRRLNGEDDSNARHGEPRRRP